MAETVTKNKKHNGWLILRRVIAGLLVAGAVALAIYLRTINLGFPKLMMGVSCALLLVLALLLSVNLRVSRALQGILGVICIGLLALGLLTQYYVRVDGRYVAKYLLVEDLKVEDEYPRHFTEMESLKRLNMLGSTITDFTPIQQITTLEELDIRGNYAFTEADRDALAAALPNCHIRWSVPVKQVYFDSDAEEMDLRQIELTTDELRGLFEKYPTKRFAYRVPLLGERYAPDTQELNLRDKAVDVPAIEDALMLLPQVNMIDLRGVPAPASAVSELTETFPDIYFKFSCDVPQAAMTTEDTKVRVTGDYDALMAYVDFIDYMPHLQSVDASEIELTSEQVDEVQTHKNGKKVLYGITVFDRKVRSDVTELNLDGIDVGSVEAVETLITRLPNLNRISLLDSGLTQDECGQLFDAHPDIKFVFWISFGHYKIRTDVTAFSTQLGDGNRYGYNDRTFEPIRYCTDLMMLDLGHNGITSLENFKGLTKLRVLILADNKITNIDPIVNFPDLEFCELFLNDITDMSPLTSLTKLMDLNIFYNPVGSNYEVLKSMTWLDRLWCGGCRLSSAQIKDLRAALPNTRINTEGRGSTGKGWRKHSHYETLKLMYEQECYIPFEDSAFKDEATE